MSTLDSTMSTQTSVGVACLALNFVIGAPLVVWSFVTLKKDWNEVYLIKRKRVLTLFIIIFASFVQLGMLHDIFCNVELV